MLREMCGRCEAGRYSHYCVGKWTRVRELAMNETREALEKHSSVSREALPVFEEGDVVIHIRLWFTQRAWFEFPSKALIEQLITKETKRVTIVMQKPREPEVELIALYKEIITRACGGCPVTNSTGTPFEDFAKIAFAPKVICFGSSYCLWAAMANKGEVWMSDILAAGERPDLGENFHWMENALTFRNRRDMLYERNFGLNLAALLSWLRAQVDGNATQVGGKGTPQR
eukprot:NODE_13689_length_1152_cov_2.387317.p1 GENE.NODE_13689_length_1152_cov_2.387317~~NODE_13689_length_1152_cov_2.387317.p1  ORF type:complete len:229 (+),score=66.48 NODE_13689_length_1152_cov_2.387317:236-922(+)